MQALALDHVSAATRLLEKRRQMFEIQEALDNQKEEFERQEEALKRREEALRRKDVELQDSLLKFNKFLQENESKRKRAMTRAAEERKQIEVKSSDIDRLNRLKDKKTAEARWFERELERNKICLELDDDLLNRYRTLRGANEDLAARQKNYEDLSQQKKEDFLKLMKIKTNDMLNANNEIAFLQDKLEQTEATTYRLQNDLDSAIRSTSDKTLELCQIVAAVDNLLERFLKHKRHTPSSCDSIEAEGKLAMYRLDEISAYMTDYADIVNDYETKYKAL